MFKKTMLLLLLCFTTNILSYNMEKFQNVLLIINFNYPYYGNVQFLKTLYQPFFKKIVFYGENEHPDVICCKTEHGFYISSVLIDAISKNPDVDGYLFLEDDCILNMWNCLDLDINKIWLLPGFTRGSHVRIDRHFITVDLITAQATEAWGWSWRLESTRHAFAQLLPEDKENLEQNLGQNIAIATSADMFYVPARYRGKMLRLCDVFKDVFIEVTVPNILAALDSHAYWEKVSIFFEVTDEYFARAWPMDHTCIHPVKLSNTNNRSIVSNVFQQKFPQLYIQ